MGGTGTGTGTGSSTGNYSYGSSGKAIGIGVGAAAAAGAGAWLLVRHNHHKAEAKQATGLVGCTESVLNQLSLRNEKDNQTYLLVANGVSLEPGKRVEVQGMPMKDRSGANAFRVRSLVNDYGGCGQGAALTANTAGTKKELAEVAK
jgi:hypothetical protein